MTEQPRTRRELLASVALASSAVLAGCGSSTDPAANETASSPNSTVESDDGNETGTADDFENVDDADDEPEPPDEYPGEFTTEETSDGRVYERYVPASAGEEDLPLVVGLHGCRQDGKRFARLTGLNELAEEERFAAVYPVQPASAHHLNCWLWWEDEHTTRGSGEAADIVGVVEETSERLAIDTGRVYVTGISAGGSMVPNLLAEYPDVFAAGAIHSGTQYDAADNQAEGLARRNDPGPDPADQGEAAFEAMGDRASPIPTMVIHGTADESFPFVHYEQNVEQAIHTNNLVLDGEPIDEEPTQTEELSNDAFEYRIEEYHAGDRGSLVEGLVIEEMGHAWAGGYADVFHEPDAPDAASHIWAFFQGRTLDEPFPA